MFLEVLGLMDHNPGRDLRVRTNHSSPVSAGPESSGGFNFHDDGRGFLSGQESQNRF
jgi:hypothetical protein